MTPTVVRQPGRVASVTSPALTAAWAAAAPLDEVLQSLDSSAQGLSGADAAARLIRCGPNALRTHRVSGDCRVGASAA
jgi:Mg2+-importing ATPase